VAPPLSSTLGVMNNKLALIFGSALLFCTSTTWAGELSASAVLADAAKVGPERAIAKYYNTPEWQVILKGIGSANDEWLRVYVELRKGSDGESGEDLSAALWDVALPRAPFKIFAIEHDDSCEFSFEAECPPGGIDNYLTRLAKALEKASTTDQLKMKEHCLAGIKKTRASFPNPKAYCSQ
jgi:hypothetical protein